MQIYILLENQRHIVNIKNNPLWFRSYDQTPNRPNDPLIGDLFRLQAQIQTIYKETDNIGQRNN